MSLYWHICDDGTIEGPTVKPPEHRTGWTIFGVRADIIGRPEWLAA